MMYFAPQFGQSKVIGSGLLGRQLAGICALIFLAIPVSEIDLYQAELQKISYLHCTRRAPGATANDIPWLLREWGYLWQRSSLTLKDCQAFSTHWHIGSMTPAW
jgi:hypothetical protein